MIENQISYEVRGAIFEVYNTLGPGLLESVYQQAMIFELKERGLQVEAEIPLPVIYKDVKLECGYRLDLLVEEKVVVELKSVEQVKDVHHKQILTYLGLSNLKLGLLVNFNTNNIKRSIFRKVNGL
jgi:GxxExxY protein